MNVRVSVDDPSFDADVNILGLLNILEPARKAGLRRVLFASSGGTVYGEPETLPAPETTPTHPVCPYGISKLTSEHYLYYYRRIFGLDYVALRYANVYGPRQDPHGEAGVVAIFSRLMLDGRRPVVNGDGEQARDYVYVDDVVDAFARAGEIGGGVRLNIGTGIPTTVNELYRLIADSAGYDGAPEFGPAKEGDLARSVIDASAARAHLGWEPWTELPAGIAKTVEAFRASS